MPIIKRKPIMLLIFCLTDISDVLIYAAVLQRGCLKNNSKSKGHCFVLGI
jgi:hypothetical protein